jgi:hypothetical protein
MKTLLWYPPRRGRRRIAQDKRSVVLGKAVMATEMPPRILKEIDSVFDRAKRAAK